MSLGPSPGTGLGDFCKGPESVLDFVTPTISVPVKLDIGIIICKLSGNRFIMMADKQGEAEQVGNVLRLGSRTLLGTVEMRALTIKRLEQGQDGYWRFFTLLW